MVKMKLEEAVKQYINNLELCDLPHKLANRISEIERTIQDIEKKFNVRINIRYNGETFSFYYNDNLSQFKSERTERKAEFDAIQDFLKWSNNINFDEIQPIRDRSIENTLYVNVYKNKE